MFIVNVAHTHAAHTDAAHTDVDSVVVELELIILARVSDGRSRRINNFNWFINNNVCIVISYEYDIFIGGYLERNKKKCKQSISTNHPTNCHYNVRWKTACT